MDVMDCVEAIRQQFLCHKEVPQICPGVMCTCITRATGFNRSFIASIPGIADIDGACSYKKLSISGVTCRDDTIKQISAKGN